MERLLSGPGWRREEQRYQPPPSSQRIARTPALSRAGGSVGPALTPGHSSRIFSPDMPLKTTNEKELLRGLNDRFAGFIEKVHRLESQNRVLEKEIEDIRLKAKSSSSLAKQYEPELQDLRRQISDMAMQKHQMELEQERVEDEFNALKEKCAEEARSRAEAEESITALKKYIDSAYLAKQDMDRKAKALADEIEFLKRNHEAEVADILTQMKATRVSAEVSGFGKGELTAALRAIRTQLEEGRALCPNIPSEQRFTNQLAKLTKAAETDREALIATKTEISQYRRQLQSKSIELDSVRGMREALERQLYDLEQRHSAEIHQYQDTVSELEQELKNTKYDMSSHVQEYQDLLNVKMALDAEIYSYRKLLEGEESRYSTLSDAQIPVPYVYRQSPIYTLPSVPRVGGVSRKAEPQYKFVEEIITETTREDIEISDTGSDDAEEQREGDKVCIEKENAVLNAVEAASEAPLEEKKTQESDTEDTTSTPNAEREDNEGKPTENETQSVNMSADVSVDLKEGGMNTEVAESNLTASEQTGEKDTDNNYSTVDDTDSKTQEPVLETKTENPQAAISGDEDVEKVTPETEKGKQDIAKEIDQVSIKQPKPTEQTAAQEAIKENRKSAVEEISPKSEEKKEAQQVAEPEDYSTGKTMEKDEETSEVKSVEVETSTTDQPTVSQKAEAEQETRPNSEADSKQSVEALQADVPDTTKAMSAQDNAAEVQKELAEKVKPEAPLKSEGKEIQSEEEKKVDSKPEVERETVEPGEGDSAQSVEAQKTQEDVSKTAAKETEVETSEKKDIQTKDTRDSAKKEESTESKKTEKEDDQIQIEEQPKVAVISTKSEEQSQKTGDGAKEDKVDSLKTESNVLTKSSEAQKEDIQMEPKSTEKEMKIEQKTEKEDSKETSEGIKKMDMIKPIGQEVDSKISTDVQPEQSVLKTSPEKEQSKDQKKTDKDSDEMKDTKPEKSDKTDSSDAKQESTKMETTKSKDLEKEPTPLQESKKLDPTEKGQVSSEKVEDKSTKADLKKDIDVPMVTENGVNI